MQPPCLAMNSERHRFPFSSISSHLEGNGEKKKKSHLLWVCFAIFLLASLMAPLQGGDSESLMFSLHPTNSQLHFHSAELCVGSGVCRKTFGFTMALEHIYFGGVYLKKLEILIYALDILIGPHIMIKFTDISNNILT